MRNKFPGQCFRCGGVVDAGAGHFERFGKTQRLKYKDAPRDITWLIQHADCAVEYRGTDKNIWSDAVQERYEQDVDYLTKMLGV